MTWYQCHCHFHQMKIDLSQLHLYTKRFEGMNEDEIQSMSLKEYEHYEEIRMQSNAWYV